MKLRFLLQPKYLKHLLAYLVLVLSFLQGVVCVYEDQSDALRHALQTRIKGQVFVDMKDCVDDMIEEFKDETILRIENPANDELFEVCDSKLSFKEKKEEFHIMVAEAPFLTKRARSDIECAVAFSSTRVFKLNEEN